MDVIYGGRSLGQMMFLLGDADQERESLAEDVAVAVAVGGVEVTPEFGDIPGPDCICIKKRASRKIDSRVLFSRE